MSKAKATTILDHVLFIRGGYGSNYEKRGRGKLDIMLIAGQPEPISNFDEQEFIDALIDDGVIISCTSEGILSDGTKHPSVGG